MTAKRDQQENERPIHPAWFTQLQEEFEKTFGELRAATNGPVKIALLCKLRKLIQEADRRLLREYSN
jgi:hypothetical protein